MCVPAADESNLLMMTATQFAVLTESLKCRLIFMIVVMIQTKFFSLMLLFIGNLSVNVLRQTCVLLQFLHAAWLVN